MRRFPFFELAICFCTFCEPNKIGAAADRLNKYRFYGNGSQKNNHGAVAWTIYMIVVLGTVQITSQSLECIEWSSETLTYRFQIKFSQDGREI